MTTRLFQRITRARNDAFRHDRNRFQALNQILIAAKLEAGEARMSSLSNQQFYSIISQHIAIYTDRITALNNPPEGSGAYGEYVDLQQRIYALEIYLPVVENANDVSPLQEM